MCVLRLPKTGMGESTRKMRDEIVRQKAVKALKEEEKRKLGRENSSGAKVTKCYGLLCKYGPSNNLLPMMVSSPP